MAVCLKVIQEMINHQGAFGSLTWRRKLISPREIQIIAAEYITQHTSKDLQNIPLFSAVSLDSAAWPLPDYCQLKGDRGCNSPQSVLD